MKTSRQVPWYVAEVFVHCDYRQRQRRTGSRSPTFGTSGSSVSAAAAARPASHYSENDEDDRIVFAALGHTVEADGAVTLHDRHAVPCPRGIIIRPKRRWGRAWPPKPQPMTFAVDHAENRHDRGNEDHNHS